MTIPSIIGAASSLYANFKNKQTAKEMAKYQNDIAIDNWHRENRYNSPAAQMQRLKDAHLNPNLIYQNGAALQPSGSIDQPQVETPSIQMDVVGPYYQAKQMSLQQDSVAQNIETQTAMADYYNRMADNQHMDFLKKVADSPYFNDVAKYNAQLAMHNMNKAAADVDQIKAETSLIQAKTGLTTQQIETEKVSREQILANIDNLKKQGRLTDVQSRSIQQGINESIARVAQIVAQTTLTNKSAVEKAVMMEYNASIASWRADEIASNVQKINEELKAIQQQNNWRDVQNGVDVASKIFDIIQGFYKRK